MRYILIGLILLLSGCIFDDKKEDSPRIETPIVHVIVRTQNLKITHIRINISQRGDVVTGKFYQFSDNYCSENIKVEPGTNYQVKIILEKDGERINEWQSDYFDLVKYEELTINSFVTQNSWKVNGI